LIRGKGLDRRCVKKGSFAAYAGVVYTVGGVLLGLMVIGLVVCLLVRKKRGVGLVYDDMVAQGEDSLLEDPEISN
jgi:hypothetical protein